MTKEKHSQPEYTELFMSFLKLGASAFGGPAIMHYIYKMAVEEKKWIDKESADRGVAFSQTLPGIISMQMAGYVGLKIRGIFGAFLAYIGLGLPAFLLMLILTIIYSKMSDLKPVMSAFHALHAIIVAIVANAAFSFGKKNTKGIKEAVLAIIAAVLFYMKLHPLFVLLISAIYAIIIFGKTKGGGKAESLNRGGGLFIYFSKIFVLATLTALAYLLLRAVDKPLWTLTFSMTKIVLLAFGGGYTSLPLMYHEIVEIHGWLKSAAFMDGIALGQITPGPFVITATFVGYLLYGIIGSLCATFGVFAPPFFLGIIIAPYFDKLNSYEFFRKAINGIVCSFTGLLLTTTIKFSIEMRWDIMLVIIAVAGFIALLKNVSLIKVVAAGTIFSIVCYSFIKF